jgi:hypothetical protein
VRLELETRLGELERRALALTGQKGNG